MSAGPATCEHCGREFARPSSLTNHERLCLDHGTVGHYIHGCRCDECRRAAADHRRRRRANAARRAGRECGTRCDDWVLDYRAGRIA